MLCFILMVDKQSKRITKSAATMGKRQRKSLAFSLRIAHFKSTAFVDDCVIRDFLTHVSLKEKFSEGT